MFSYVVFDAFIIISVGFVFVVVLAWNFFVVSKNLFLQIFARNGRSDSSDILKNATKRKIPITGAAMTLAVILLPPHFTIVFQIISHNQLPIATKTSCTRDTLKGQI